MLGDEPLLLVGADVVTLDEDAPRVRAVLVKRRRIAWTGADPDLAPVDDARRLDLSGTTVLPAFVNAHTHLTQLGLALNAMDLSLAESLPECLNAVQAIATVTPHRVIWAGGWDETLWPEHRPPSADEVSEAAGDRPAMLMRADGHCVVVDRTSLSALPLARARGVERGSDGRPTGLLRQEAAQVAQRWFTAELPDGAMQQARRAAANHLASLGVASAHEMGGPHRMGPGDFDAWLEGEWPLEVIGYWGEADLEFVAARGLRRVGGSLLLDGTIGSHSAALQQPYADRPGSGQLYRDDSELVEFSLEASQRGIQVAFHAIGDRAVEQAIRVFEVVAEEIGLEQLRRVGHRLEYAALVQVEQMARLARLGVVVTLQPATDLSLGSAGGAYEQRLGAARAQASNPLRLLEEHGVTLAFGADSVVRLDPWLAIEEAARGRMGSSPLDSERGLVAATIGGRIAAHQPNVGALRPGHRADLTAFEHADDPRQRRCVLTMVAGRVTHDARHELA